MPVLTGRLLKKECAILRENKMIHEAHEMTRIKTLLFVSLRVFLGSFLVFQQPAMAPLDLVAHPSSSHPF